ncbi:MAG: L,D-transpeptidase [Actinomycetota bacterium]
MDGKPVRSRLFRGGATLLAGMALLGPLALQAATARAHASLAVRPTQQLVALYSPRKAWAEPSAKSALIAPVPARRPITAVRTVLPVLGQRTSSGFRWLHVRLPGRPNGRTGWIKRRATRSWRTNWHIVIDTSTRRVVVYRHGRPARSFRAIVGKPSTPTPLGEFFVEESIRLSSQAVGAPFALALSARSNVYQEFAGGPGQIAMHGLNHVGGTLGTAASHGCVRLNTAAIRWLAAHIGSGIPVTITP